MPKFTFICEHDDGTKNTHECDEVFLPNILENFEAFLRGATFNFKGNLDFFDDSDTELDEDYDEFELSSWGQVAEKILDIGNGALVRVKGRVKVEKWSEGGETKSAVRIAAENVTVLCY